jgi:hypothetical protein
MAREIREEFRGRLTREELEKVGRAFRSNVVPKRKPGRRPKSQVTAALADWKAGVRAAALFQAHIPGWDKKSKWRQRCESRTLLDAVRTRRKRQAE